MIDDLNTSHAIPDHVQFAPGPNDLPVARIRNAHASAEIHLHGAHVTAFQPHDSQPVLWMSREAFFEPPKPIRGGVPICWPWFGSPAEHPERPQHGFARNRQWTVAETKATDDGQTVITFRLQSDDDTLALWPHPFELTYRVTVSAGMRLELSFRNTGQSPAEVATALHTYFAVGDSARVRITGLDGRPYHDQLDGMQLKPQSGDIAITEEVDRIYIDTEDECVIHDESMNRRIRVAKTGSQSTVVWNPWIAKSQRMPDFPDDGYREMVCIETTNAASDTRTIAPGDTHVISQTLSAE